MRLLCFKLCTALIASQVASSSDDSSDAPIRPVVFEDAGVLTEDTVHLPPRLRQEYDRPEGA